MVVCVLWPDARLDHPECTTVLAIAMFLPIKFIHPHTQNAGARSHCRWGRFGQSVQVGRMGVI